MRVKEIGTRPAPVAIRELFSLLVRGRAPAISVHRREVPYWEERGWIRRGDTYTGSYQTPYVAFEGRIEEERSGNLNFFLHSPSRKIMNSGHWACFAARGGDWFFVHMARRPKDVSSGIITIERLIREAYE